VSAIPESHHDAVVIGGGLLGAVLTWMLAKEGLDTVLLEKDQINQNASGQNAGSLHYQLEYRMVERGLEAARTAAEAMPLHLEAAALWESLADELGESLGVSHTGGLMLAETREEAAVLEQKSELERSWGLDVRMLDGESARSMAPYLSDSVIAAAFCPLEGKADARRAAPTFARAALAEGAHIFTGERVVGLERRDARWHIDVQSSAEGEIRQRRIVCETVMLAAGVWTSQLGRMLGVDLPAIALALTMTVTMRTAPLIPHLVQHAGKRLSLKQVPDGTVLIGGGWPAGLPLLDDGNVDIDGRPSLLRDSLAGNARAATGVVPRLGTLPVLRSWVGTTTVTPDQLPLVGPVPECPGVYVATGGSAFTLGPSFSKALVDLAVGRRPSHDLAPYHPLRFGGVVHA
jgi:sarcosine oxidase subunit beta